jgi:hypothetical protein
LPTRYNAACAASLAGAVQRVGRLFDLDESERTRWRKQAIDWLQADLAALKNRSTTGDPAIRAGVSRMLSNWRENSELAALRERTALEKLPLSEQQECQRLWCDVDAVLRIANESK